MAFVSGLFRATTIDSARCVIRRLAAIRLALLLTRQNDWRNIVVRKKDSGRH